MTKLSATTQRKKRVNDKINVKPLNKAAARLKKVEKATKIFEMCRDGHKWDDICKHFGVKRPGNLRKILDWYLHQYLPDTHKDSIKKLLVGRLDDLYTRVTKSLEDPDNFSPAMINAATKLIEATSKITGVAVAENGIQTQYNVQINQYVDVSKMLFDPEADPTKARRCNPIKHVKAIPLEAK